MFKHFFLFQFILLNTVFSQGIIEIKGRLINESNNEVIPFAYVLAKGTNHSTQSDEQGNFILKTKQSPVILVVYQTGFYTSEREVATDEMNSLIIKLKPKDFSLDEVTVTGNKVTVFQKENNSVYLGFEFYDNMIMGLVDKGGNTPYIQLLNDEGKIISEVKTPKGSEFLFKDCFGNIQLLTKDSCYQVYYNYVKIHFLSGFPVSLFQNFLLPCQCSYGDDYYFKVINYRGLKNVYYFTNRNDSKNKKLLTVAADSAAIKAFNIDYDINYFLNRRKLFGEYPFPVSEIKLHIDKFREQLVLPPDYSNLMRPVSSELVNIDSFLYVIDYSNKKISGFFRRGEKIKEYFFNDISDIKPGLLIDPDRKKTFFVKEDKGETLLIEHDIADGKKTGKEKKISDYFFIKNLRIKNGYVYFIYRDKREDNDPRKIYKLLLTTN